LDTPLVVADESRGKGAICLAVSSKMKAMGVKNRCRLFEIPSHINYIIAKPRMKKYIEHSARIYGVYLKYIAKEDIHVYSIDEAFLDVTHYYKLYKKSAVEIGQMILNDIVETTGLTATCGVGTNLYLAKVALDIYAKKNNSNIAYLNEEIYKKYLWNHLPLTDFWQVGSGISKRLNKMGLKTMEDVTKTNEEALYKEFGINASFLIDHAHGRESTEISDIKKYQPKAKSLSSGQILEKNYSFREALVVVKEMVELLCLDLIRQKLVSNHISLGVGYDDSLDLKSTGGSKKLSVTTNSYEILQKEFVDLYNDRTHRNASIRRINLGLGNLQDESQEQYDLFCDIERIEKEKRLLNAVNDIKEKYGNSSMLRVINLETEATTKKRNKLIGGHNAE
jgi:DNA polymerase V